MTVAIPDADARVAARRGRPRGRGAGAPQAAATSRSPTTTRALRERVNEYAPVAAILAAQHEDGSWAPPSRDYQKYGGSLWQVHFLGELWADPRRRARPARGRLRVLAAAARRLVELQRPPRRGDPLPHRERRRARSRASATRADERVVRRARAGRGRHAADRGTSAARRACGLQPQRLLPHARAQGCCCSSPRCPREPWPDGAEELRDDRGRRTARQGGLPLPARRSRASSRTCSGRRRAEERDERARARSSPSTRRCTTATSPGGCASAIPLSYNSDVLEALAALAAVGETRRPEYEAALAVVAQGGGPRDALEAAQQPSTAR